MEHMHPVPHDPVEQFADVVARLREMPVPSAEEDQVRRRFLSRFTSVGVERRRQARRDDD